MRRIDLTTMERRCESGSTSRCAIEASPAGLEQVLRLARELEQMLRRQREDSVASLRMARALALGLIDELAELQGIRPAIEAADVPRSRG